MGRLSAFLPVFALLAAAATGLAACGDSGSDELLPGATANEINANLSQVEQLVAEDECIGAENSAAAIGTQVEELTGVDKGLKRALAEGAARLSEKVAAECEQASEEETVPTVEEAEEAPAEKAEREKAEKEAEKEAKEAEKEAKQAEKEEENEGPTLPPQSNGKGEETGQGEGPPVEPPESEGPPSGGVGPGTAVEGESG